MKTLYAGETQNVLIENFIDLTLFYASVTQANQICLAKTNAFC